MSLGCTLLLAQGACSPLDLANALTSRSGYVVEHDLTYGGDDRQSLDLYRPDEIMAGSPAVLFFYGGRWQFGDKDDYLFAGQALASRGYLTMVADYRLFPQTNWQGFVDDALSALKLAASLSGSRPVVLAGHSAGGYLAAMAALDQERQAARQIRPCQIGGLIGLAGPFDFLPLVQPDIISVFGPGEAGAETQPITFADANDPPALLIHGTDDDTVGIHNSQNLAQALIASGGTAKTAFYDGVGHAGLIASFAWPLRSLSPALDDISAFLNQLPEIDHRDCY